MQLIKGYKDLWNKKISLRDRLLFALVLLIVGSIYFWSNFIRKDIPFGNYQWYVLLTITIILLIACTPTPGGWIVKLWLMISSTIGKLVFAIILFLVYFLIISPLFILVNLFRKKDKSGTGWKEPMLNKDYLNMG
jgi:hypothetical protein